MDLKKYRHTFTDSKLNSSKIDDFLNSSTRRLKKCLIIIKLLCLNSSIIKQCSSK